MIELPEYDDKENQRTNFEWSYSDLLEIEQYSIIINQMHEFIDFFSDEQCSIMYDGNNLSAFLFPINRLDAYYPSVERILRAEMKQLRNWRKNSLLKKDYPYEIFNSGFISNEVRCEVAERQRLNIADSYLIVVCKNEYEKKNWTIEVNDNNQVVSSCNMDIPCVFKWISIHRSPRREYNWNEKHGENGVGAHLEHDGSPVSVLMCSRDEASRLLPYAIGNKGYDKLFAYDQKFSLYMEFKAEVKARAMNGNETIRKYHSYHIQDENRVENRVKKKLAIVGQK